MKSSQELHEKLAQFYRNWRGDPAPTNSYTEHQWERIERQEAEEAAHG